MKLIIQIPCLNEAETLPRVLAQLPRELAGFDAVEWLVIDDGSTDRTAEVAHAHGVDHVVRLTNNKGLAAAFQAGVDAALKLGADVIVNLDADDHVGDRGVDTIEHFSATKKALQRLGSWVVRRLSGTDIADTTSGFRAYNREAALQLVVVSNFTYTLESLIQAGKMLIAVDEVEVETNPKTRWSMIRCPLSRSPITPSAPSSIAALKSTAPRISDCTWPAPSPWIQEIRKRVQTATAAIPTRAAADMKTLSGS